MTFRIVDWCGDYFGPGKRWLHSDETGVKLMRNVNGEIINEDD